MADTERKRYLLRIDPRLYAALEKWAVDDLRSVNAQIEYLLSEALRRAGRSKLQPAAASDEPPDRTAGSVGEEGSG